MDTDTGRLPDGTGLSPTVEPASGLAGSAASIPSAGQWIVVRESSPFGWARYGATEAGKVTAKLVKFARRGTDWGAQARIEQVVACFDDRTTAEQLAQALQGIAGEYMRKKMNADRELRERLNGYAASADKRANRLIASAIEARRAETHSGSVHESAVGNAETPAANQPVVQGNQP